MKLVSLIDDKLAESVSAPKIKEIVAKSLKEEFNNFASSMDKEP